MSPKSWVDARHRRTRAASAGTPRRRERPVRDDFHWIIVGADRHRFLQPIFDGFGISTLRLWVEDGTPAADFSRTRCHGLVTAVGTFHGRPVAVAWSDFMELVAGKLGGDSGADECGGGHDWRVLGLQRERPRRCRSGTRQRCIPSVAAH